MWPCQTTGQGVKPGLSPCHRGDPSLPQSAQQPSQTKVLHRTPAANWLPGASTKLHIFFVASHSPGDNGQSGCNGYQTKGCSMQPS